LEEFPDRWANPMKKRKENDLAFSEDLCLNFTAFEEQVSRSERPLWGK
jgi:hypothetical protein